MNPHCTTNGLYGHSRSPLCGDDRYRPQDLLFSGKYKDDTPMQFTSRVTSAGLVFQINRSITPNPNTNSL